MKKFVLFVVLLAAVICCVSCAPNLHLRFDVEYVYVDVYDPIANQTCIVSVPNYRAYKDGPDVDYKLTHTALLPEHLYFTEYRKHEN
jgi:hypothetical protein